MTDSWFMRAICGTDPGRLGREDLMRFHRIVRDGKATRDAGKAARVVVGHGDGKKSGYGPTYADELIDSDLW